MNIITSERNFYEKLPQKTRLLIASFALRSFATPLLTIFINSFIWRTTSSLFGIAIYNLGYFIFLPFGFYINGLLLKKIKITKLYLSGLMISAISVVAVIFFSGSHLWHFIVYGLVYGFGSGLYWPNRNFLSFQETEPKQRNYFFSINSVFRSLIIICITFLGGWFIVFGEQYNLYNPTTAYWIFSIITLLVLISSGIIILKTNYKSPKIDKTIQLHISKKWNRVRLINCVFGLSEGLGHFFPTLLILLYLGSEGVLGTINTIVTLSAVVIIYLYGRLSKWNHRRPIFFLSLLFFWL